MGSSVLAMARRTWEGPWSLSVSPHKTTTATTPRSTGQSYIETTHLAQSSPSMVQISFTRSLVHSFIDLLPFLFLLLSGLLLSLFLADAIVSDNEVYMNQRYVSLVQTANFGTLAFVSVGATCVGSIVENFDVGR